MIQISNMLTRLLMVAVTVFAMHLPAAAQSDELRFVTVDRPPFSTIKNGEIDGFSIELMRAIADDIGLKISFEMTDGFAQMLDRVESSSADGAIANISITREREAMMDFTQPIFLGGLQIMVPADHDQPNIWSVLFSWDLVLAIFAAFALLMGGGMLMWFFERGKQPYFDGSAREAIFPSFWWALNLVVNGGFEERIPRSAFGRVFGTFLVISSLFIVSVFVAHITASITVKAISGSIHTVSDLGGKRVGTTKGSTASLFLDDRDIKHVGYNTLGGLLEDFEKGDLEAVVFDGPVLSYYARHEGAKYGQVLDSVFRPENYGIALPTGSPLREEINVALLRLIETGTYSDISNHYFGAN